MITLQKVKLSGGSGVLVSAAADQWGTKGSNGGNVLLTAQSQTLQGSVTADRYSTIALKLLQDSTLSGAVNTAKTAKSISLTLDASSTWSVTANSHLTSLSGAVIHGSTITNIMGNRHTVTYDTSAAANSYLGRKTYTLANGGTLGPA